jgi:hypothetical protein
LVRLLKWGPASSETAHSRDPCRSRVKRSLYQRAKGYSYEAVKIFMPANREKLGGPRCVMTRMPSRPQLLD